MDQHILPKYFNIWHKKLGFVKIYEKVCRPSLFCEKMK